MNQTRHTTSRFFAALLPAAPVSATNGDAENADVSIAGLWASLWRGRRFIMLVTVLFLILGIALTFVMGKRYSVTMRVTPPSSSDQSASGSVSMMSSLLGGGSKSNQQFQNFLALLHSNSLSLEMNANPKMLPIIYGKHAAEPDKISVAATDKFLKAHVTTLQKKGNALLGDKSQNIVMISASAKTPQAAMDLLNTAVRGADDILRAAEKKETTRKIQYLQQRLQNTKTTEYRDTLIKMISQNEQRAMLLNTSDHYAYFLLDVPVLVKKPISPKPKINILISLLAGLMFSMLFVLIRDGRRGALR